VEAASSATIARNSPGQYCRLWVSEQGEILDFCRYFQTMFGFRDGEMRGQPLSLLLPGLADTTLLQAGRVNSRLGACRT
jgi:hypothetical protein